MARTLTAHWRWLTGLTVVTLAAGFALPFVAPAPELQEKRPLADFPAWPKRPADLDAFRKGVDAYVADRFPARPYLIATLNAARLPLGISGSDRVILGREGWLFYDNGTQLGAARNDPPMTLAETRRWLDGLAGRTEALERQGVPYLVLVAPQKETLWPQMGPDWYAGPDPDRPAVALSRMAASSGAGNVLYLHDALVQATRWGVKTYSRHDTHWTGLGAYEAYRAIMARLRGLGLGEAARPLTDFRELPRSPDDPRDLALMLGVSSFVKVDFPRFDDPGTQADLEVTYLTRDRSWMGARVIDTGQAGKPVLLMTVDSFSTALLPFLYSHFSRLVIAHNQDGTWRQDLIERFKPDLVVLEVIESGLPASLTPAPAASEAARGRIARIVAQPRTSRPLRRVAAEAGAELSGGGLDDDLNGRQGNDTLDGRGGNDVERGGRGGDLIHGGPGDDWLSGDRGDDTLWGQAGADTFHSFGEAGIDRVMDFSAAEGDRVELEPGATYQIVQRGADTVIRLAGGAEVILVGVTAESLPKNAIVFKSR